MNSPSLPREIRIGGAEHNTETIGAPALVKSEKVPPIQGQQYPLFGNGEFQNLLVRNPPIRSAGFERSANVVTEPAQAPDHFQRKILI
jgi:hypothetical protein